MHPYHACMQLSCTFHDVRCSEVLFAAAPSVHAPPKRATLFSCGTPAQRAEAAFARCTLFQHGSQPDLSRAALHFYQHVLAL